jgi:steroid delta-isomerase-like uncharacterized protein
MADAKEISRRLTEDPWQGKLDDVIDYVADDYVGHNPGLPEPVTGKAGYREFIGTYMAAFPDGRITVDEQIAEDDTVTTRWTAVGTNDGELMGMAPTGKEVTVTGITYSKIEDGKLHESWTSWDTFSMLQQLGAVPEGTPTTTT